MGYGTGLLITESFSSKFSLKQGWDSLKNDHQTRLLEELLPPEVHGCLLLEGLRGVPDIGSPGILGNGVAAGCLDPQVVDASHDPEHPVLSPVLSPRVPPDPILHSIFHSPADHVQRVVVLRHSRQVVENTPSVVPEFRCGSQRARNRPSLVNLLHHRLFPFQFRIPFDRVHLRPFRSETPSSRSTVSAFRLIITNLPFFPSFRFVDRAGFVGHLVLHYVIEGT